MRLEFDEPISGHLCQSTAVQHPMVDPGTYRVLPRISDRFEETASGLVVATLVSLRAPRFRPPRFEFDLRFGLHLFAQRSRGVPGCCECTASGRFRLDVCRFGCGCGGFERGPAPAALTADSNAVSAAATA